MRAFQINCGPRLHAWCHFILSIEFLENMFSHSVNSHLNVQQKVPKNFRELEADSPDTDIKIWFQTGRHVLQSYTKYDSEASTIEKFKSDFRVSYLRVYVAKPMKTEQYF